jgi:hypothetical protein
VCQLTKQTAGVKLKMCVGFKEFFFSFSRKNLAKLAFENMEKLRKLLPSPLQKIRKINEIFFFQFLIENAKLISKMRKYFDDMRFWQIFAKIFVEIFVFAKFTPEIFVSRKF